MNTLVVANQQQKTLFECELAGQLSDGYWENARPNRHWMDWCCLNVVVGTNVGRNFHPLRDKYNLTNAELLNVVGKRMLAYARWSFIFSVDMIKQLDKLLNIYGEWRGIPNEDGEYWDKVRANLNGHNCGLARSLLENEDLYTMRSLKADLHGIQLAMRKFIVLDS